MTYRFVQGIDYGPRKGTEGFAVHMAEGGDGTLAYLARRQGETDAQWKTRVRGVSANFVILSTGEVVQMVRWGNASGSMNPRDRGPSSGFYNTNVIQSVLGSHYTDPNAWSLSVEITGFREQGPNAKQTDALIALVADARRRYPQLVGAYGHADQTDTKGCPGKAPEMMRFWQTVGHGPFLPDTATEDPMGPTFNADYPPTPGVATTTTDISIIPAAGEAWKEVPAGYVRNVVTGGTITSGQYTGERAYFVAVPDGAPASMGYLLAAAATFVPSEPASFNAGVEAAAEAALTAKR